MDIKSKSVKKTCGGEHYQYATLTLSVCNLRFWFQLVIVPPAFVCWAVGGYSTDLLIVLGNKEQSLKSTEDGGICKLLLLCLVTLPTGVRSSSWISMIAVMAVQLLVLAVLPGMREQFPTRNLATLFVFFSRFAISAAWWGSQTLHQGHSTPMSTRVWRQLLAANHPPNGFQCSPPQVRVRPGTQGGLQVDKYAMDRVTPLLE